MDTVVMAVEQEAEGVAVAGGRGGDEACVGILAARAHRPQIQAGPQARGSAAARRARTGSGSDEPLTPHLCPKAAADSTAARLPSAATRNDPPDPEAGSG